MGAFRTRLRHASLASAPCGTDWSVTGKRLVIAHLADELKATHNRTCKGKDVYGKHLLTRLASRKTC